jgi:hypothetical protein
LTFKYQGRTVVLKSPGHTARIRLILDMFPQARFIHLVRDPYDVFASTRHLYDTMAWYLYLQRPGNDLNDFILKQYRTMYDAFFAQRSLIPAGQYYQVRYETLVREPDAVLEAIYQQFNLGDFAAFRPRLARHLQSIKGYQKNVYPDLPSPLRAQIAQTWQRNFEAWDYPTQVGRDAAPALTRLTSS